MSGKGIDGASVAGMHEEQPFFVCFVEMQRQSEEILSIPMLSVEGVPMVVEPGRIAVAFEVNLAAQARETPPEGQ